MSPITGLLIFVGGLSLVVLAFVLRRRLASRRALERRVQELYALAEASRAIVSATLEVGRLCELIYQQASSIVDTSTFQLGLFEGDRYHIQLWQVSGVRQPPAVFDLKEGEGISAGCAAPAIWCATLKQRRDLPARLQASARASAAVFVPPWPGRCHRRHAIELEASTLTRTTCACFDHRHRQEPLLRTPAC
jgi:hypothetical protein